MRWLYSGIYWLVFAPCTLLAATLVIVTGILTRPFDRRLRLAQYVGTIWGAAMFRMNPRWSIEVRHPERLESRGAAVVCANHQSNADVFALCVLHGSWRWVSKLEVLWVPFIGWANFVLGTPFVRRGDKESGKKVLAQSKRWLDRGVSIILFPEGTRSADGNLQAFKPGAFKLAIETRRPVVPIVIEGTRQALPKGSSNVWGRAHVVISVLEPVEVEPFVEKFDVDGLSARVREVIAKELEQIRAAASQAASPAR